MFNYVFEALISLEESLELTFASITNQCFAEVVILIFSCKQGYVDASLYLSAYLFSGKLRNAMCFFFSPKATDPRSSIMWIINFFVNYLCSFCLSKAKLVLVWKTWKQKCILEGKRHNLWANEPHQELCEKGHMSLKDARSCVLITGKQSTFFKKKKKLAEFYFWVGSGKDCEIYYYFQQTVVSPKW